MPDLITRPRRLRSFQALRNLVAESRLDRAMLVQPHFVVPGTGISEPIDAMPGIEHQSVDRLVATVGADLGLGIRSLLLFGVPEESCKAPDGRAAWADDAAVVEAVRAAGFPVLHALWMEPSTSGADSAPDLPAQPDAQAVLFEIQETEGRT